MVDPKKWKIARSRLHALRDHLPLRPGHPEVADYHSLIDALEAASGEELNEFRINLGSMKPRRTSIRIGGQYSPGRDEWSSEVYADSVVFKRQVEGLSSYVASIEMESHSATPSVPNDYWAMTTPQLEALADKYQIGGYGDQRGYTDREIIIRALLNRDRAINPHKPVSQHTINVGTMTGSAIQAGTQESHITINFAGNEVQSLVRKIRASMDEIELGDGAKAEMNADLATIETQLQSPHPKSIIISECLSTIKTILLGVVGSLIATGLAAEIANLLKK
jgi:hypothetical protein